jgi:hypothetical protein
MEKIYRAFTVVVFVAVAYVVGNLTGYAVGYNQRLAVEVAKYRVEKKLVEPLKKLAAVRRRK